MVVDRFMDNQVKISLNIFHISLLIENNNIYNGEKFQVSMINNF